ncbi:hypothetical protein N431DRAFT_551755 [Stipitochalara longipes BDJ]|nr:hypothetical protein N431DRAFT_551755 [Stipitochalara longipes BDJ]
MQLKPVLAAAGLLASLAIADPNPQSPQQTTAAVEALESYAEMIATQTDFLSIISSLSTDTAALASVTAFEASVSKQLRAGQTVGPDYLDGLPSGVRPFFASIVSLEYSILSSNGFTSRANQLPTTATSTAAAPRETGGLRVAGAVAVGLVGAVIAL